MVEGVASDSRTFMRHYCVVIELSIEDSTYVLTCNQTCNHLQSNETIEPSKSLRFECKSLDDMFELVCKAYTGLVDDADKAGIDDVLFEDAMRDLEENIMDALGDFDLACLSDAAQGIEITGTEEECIEVLRKRTGSSS